MSSHHALTMVLLYLAIVQASYGFWKRIMNQNEIFLLQVTVNRKVWMGVGKTRAEYE